MANDKPVAVTPITAVLPRRGVRKSLAIAMEESKQPRIAVGLAVFNGLAYLPTQLDSILSQAGIGVAVFVSVDPSTDGTEEWLRERALTEPRLRLLPPAGTFGSAAANFLRLLRDVDLQGFDYFCFADQDDIWRTDKLVRACQQMHDNNAEGYSSNAVAFWPDGRRQLLSKAHRQQRSDHWFESAGPGCTYVLKGFVARELSEWIRTHEPELEGIEFHDWLIYAWVRSRGYQWWIDPIPSMEYRQHDSNVFGARVGWAAGLRRVRLLLNGWYFDQALRIGAACGALEVHPLLRRLKRDRLLDRIVLLSHVRQMRRKHIDRVMLAVALLIGRRRPI